MGQFDIVRRLWSKACLRCMVGMLQVTVIADLNTLQDVASGGVVSCQLLQHQR